MSARTSESPRGLRNYLFAQVMVSSRGEARSRSASDALGRRTDCLGVLFFLGGPCYLDAHCDGDLKSNPPVI